MIRYRVVPDGLFAFDELIRRNRELLARAAALCVHVQQVNQTSVAYRVEAERAQVLRQAARAARHATRVARTARLG